MTTSANAMTTLVGSMEHSSLCEEGSLESWGDRVVRSPQWQYCEWVARELL